MPFQGFAQNPEGPVGAGIDSIIIQDGQVVSFASGVRMNEDHEIEGIRTIGYHGDRDFKSMGYTASFDVDTYVLRGENVAGALALPGYLPDGTYNLNKVGYFDFVVADVHTLNVLFTMLACKLSTSSVDFPARGLNTRSTTWRTRSIVPGVFTS